ncbi:MAG: cob(I)yrinic acid a,c-diamide adenosyltransferase [Oligoflexia bacterium]|nr:cob(I)yrinic acid a,c-diamide adenosyltransferase [Oligoflexia bacterium]MBF0364197.1 cob(I)yrinic acid a,c-diamide adenosyltransferase [Oligoflexia bacterium]
MSIYTKAGDSGTTGLLSGHRVKKNDLRVESYGTLDELNSHIGLLRASIADQRLLVDVAALVFIQHKIFNLCSMLACESQDRHKFKLVSLQEEDVVYLEKQIDQMDEELPTLSKFIVPTGTSCASIAQVCRSVCRRAERRLLNFKESASEDEIPANTEKFINRLSDYLFTFARYLNFKAGAPDTFYVLEV